MAEAALLQALSDVRDGVDALPAVTAAEAALRVEAGELPESELEGIEREYGDAGNRGSQRPRA